MANAERKALEHGDVMEDGWAYVGLDDGKDVFAKGYGLNKWKEAMDFAASQGAHLGSDDELNLLQENVVNNIIRNDGVAKADKKSLKDMFDVGVAYPLCLVWGSLSGSGGYEQGYVRVQKSRDGSLAWALPSDCVSTFLFRSEDPHRPEA